MQLPTSPQPVLLVLDDDSAVRHSLKFSLEIEGFIVRLFSSAHELLDSDNLLDADALLVNFDMPEMNGLELTAKLRDRRIMLPVILMTGDMTETLRHRAAAAEVSVIEKPFLGTSLVDGIHQTLAARLRFKR
ncbi:MAG TPA: response regulator [Xanthobacteraceae bacterium]|nr:response regulator [Xanthobacteraceae bacterium]